jgi:pilus assembly protein CpaC
MNITAPTRRKLLRQALTLAMMVALPLAAARSVNAATGHDGPRGPVDFVQLNNSNYMLHLLVGRSMFLDTATPLKRVYVSDPAVLNSFTASPHQVLITAQKPGVSSLVVWDESGRSNVYTVSSDIDVSGLQAAINAAFPHDMIHASALQDRVTLTGVVATESEAAAAEKLAQGYAKTVEDSIDLAPQHVQQVQLKVRFAEVDRTRAQQLGFNFISAGRNAAVTGTQQFPSFSNYTLGGNSAANPITVSNPLDLLLYSSDLNLGATIQALENDQVLQILAEPTITSISGVEASFLSGGQFPFPVVQGGTNGFTSVTVQFRPYGVKLDFTPYVNPDGTIRLKVAPEVSALDYTNEVQISGYSIPAIDTRRAKTEVVLKNGQSFAISGLLDHRLTNDYERMPGISRIPILGQLFKSYQKQASTTDLIVIVTPTIVDPLHTPMAEPKLPALAKPYLDNKLFDQRLKKHPHRKKQKGNPPPMPVEP